MAKSKASSTLINVIAKMPILADGERINEGEQFQLSESEAIELMKLDPPAVELLTPPAA